MTKQDFRDIHQHPPTMMSVGLFVLILGVLICTFGAIAGLGLLWYALWVFPLAGIGWLVYGCVSYYIAEAKIEAAIKARKEKERAQEGRSSPTIRSATVGVIDLKG